MLAILILLVGLLDMSVGYGLLEGHGWAWWAGVVINILGLLVGLVELATISAAPVIFAAIVKTVVILFYLSKRNVRVFFEIRL